MPDDGDTYMVVKDRDDDANFPDWTSNTAKAELGYSTSNPDLVKRSSGAVNLYETIVRSQPLSPCDDDVRLRLLASF
jgi:hypothetical protein